MATTAVELATKTHTHRHSLESAQAASNKSSGNRPPARIIEPDQFLGKMNGADWTPEIFEKAWNRALQEFDAALKQPGVRRAVLLLGIPGAGKSTLIAKLKLAGDVILDEAKLVYPARRKAAAAVARRIGVPVEVIWVDTPLSVCMARNNLRAANRKVPDAILQEADMLLHRLPPSHEPIFAAVHKVSGSGKATPNSAPPLAASLSAAFVIGRDIGSG